MPQDKSIIHPLLYCVKSGHAFYWYEFIPVAGFFLRRAKCGHCGECISAQYPLVELLTGMLWLGLSRYYGFNSQLFVAVCFSGLLLVIAVIDLQHQIIPDKLNIAGGVLALVTNPISDLSIVSAVSGALAGGMIMLFIAVVSQGGIGGGDIKMVAWLGLFLGWKLTLLALMLSFVTGGLSGLLLLLAGIKKRKDLIPFGPFLALGGFTAYICGCEILAWYLTHVFKS